jgi:hypothetical protein
MEKSSRRAACDAMRITDKQFILAALTALLVLAVFSRCVHLL